MLFRPAPMVHMQVQVPNRDAPAVTHCIASQGVLHLIDIAHGHVPATSGPSDPRQLLAAFRDLSTRVRRTAGRLSIELPELSGNLELRAPDDFSAERRVLDAALAPVEHEIADIWARLSSARESLRRLAAAKHHVESLEDGGVPVDRLANMRFLRLRFGWVAPEAAGEIAAFASPAPVCVLVLRTEHARSLVAVATNRESAAQVDAAVGLVPFEAVDPPIDQLTSGRDLAREQTEGEAEVEDLTAAMAAAAVRLHDTLIELWQRAALASVLLQAVTQFGATGRFLVIAGWIPAEHADALANRIIEVSQRRAIVTIERPDEMPEVAARALHIPILHRNPVLLRPFESLVEMYGRPGYREVQPTTFFAFSFLLMFGLMFGDLGHGAVLFSAGYCLYRWLPRFLDYGILLMEVGVASSLFGVLYGSFFGIEGLLPVLWIEPVRDLPQFMMIALGIGVSLISLGFVLNVINHWRAGERAEAVFGFHGLFGAFLYWSLLGLFVRALKPAAWTIPPEVIAALLVTAVLLIALKRPLVRLLNHTRSIEPRTGTSGPKWLVALESSVELVDTVVTFFANTVSFIRVAAFAAVHAGVFIAMFALADTLAELRFGGALALMALVAGNIVMILLEGLTVSVQVLRLEYYEFFGKFFRGGGDEYRPLVLKTKEGM